MFAKNISALEIQLLEFSKVEKKNVFTFFVRRNAGKRLKKEKFEPPLLYNGILLIILAMLLHAIH
jgi:hypothetical protein